MKIIRHYFSTYDWKLTLLINRGIIIYALSWEMFRNWENSWTDHKILFLRLISINHWNSTYLQYYYCLTLSSKSSKDTFLLFSKAENYQTSKCRIFCSNKDIKSGESTETFLNIKLFNKIYGQHVLTFGQHFAFVRKYAQSESVFFGCSNR